MYLINTARGVGKTHSLIMDSVKTGATIIEPTSIQAKIIEERASLMGVKIPKPISAYDIVSGNQRGRHNIDYLVDEFPQVMTILLGGQMIGATSSITIIDIV